MKFIGYFSDHTKGFGGKFGVQTDRQDKSAENWQYQGKVAPHESQVGKSLGQLRLHRPFHVYLYFFHIADHSKGFGGKFGVQTDRQDKSAENWQYQGKVAPHESQVGKLQNDPFASEY